jgi:hypothetical protein
MICIGLNLVSNWFVVVVEFIDLGPKSLQIGYDQKQKLSLFEKSQCHVKPRL